MPTINQYGDFSQPTFRAPAFNNWDLAIARSFPFGEGRRLEFRWSAFNVANRAQWAFPNTTGLARWDLEPGATSLAQGSATILNAHTFGRVLNKVGHREMEIALRLYF